MTNLTKPNRTAQPLQPGITLLGLGLGDASQLTRQAWDWLNQIDTVYVRDTSHPAVAGFPPGLRVESFSAIFAADHPVEGAAYALAAQVVAMGAKAHVTYAVSGHPYVADATAAAIIHLAESQDVPLRVLDGISFVEPALTALGVTAFPAVTVVDAASLNGSYAPLFSPSQPALIAQLSSAAVAAGVKHALSVAYPDHFGVRLVHAPGSAQPLVEDLPLEAIDRSPHLGPLSLLYLPALGVDASLEFFQEVVAHLRDPRTGCPWDREQTHASLRPYLLEETYEALEALDTGDMGKVSEELGDLLLQIVLHAQIGVEAGEFSMADIVQGISRKIIHRHPHVFGEVRVSGVSGVLTNWERLKAEERANNGEKEKGMLDSVPRILAALALAQEYQERAARVGFDWSEIGPVRAKILEEMEEVNTAPNEAERAKELGDLLFAVVNLVRWYKVDAETTLRETSNRFRRRFEYIEKTARQQGRNLNEMTLAEMDVFWEQAKEKEKE